MAVAGMVDKLNAQMNRVFYSSNLYMQLSTWCSENSLNGSAYFLRQQAQGSVTQMMRLFDYMKKSGANPTVGEISVKLDECDSLETLFQQTLKDHQIRYQAFTHLSDHAKALNDTPTICFLEGLGQALEQDGVLLKTILDEVRQASDAGMCMKQTDNHLAHVVNRLH